MCEAKCLTHALRMNLRTCCTTLVTSSPGTPSWVHRFSCGYAWSFSRCWTRNWARLCPSDTLTKLSTPCNAASMLVSTRASRPTLRCSSATSSHRSFLITCVAVIAGKFPEMRVLARDTVIPKHVGERSIERARLQRDIQKYPFSKRRHPCSVNMFRYLGEVRCVHSDAVILLCDVHI